MRNAVLQIDPRDNVLIALEDLNAGESVAFAGTTYVLVSSVPSRHKFAARDLSAGDPIRMYGVVVGQAASTIRSGERLTVSNVQPEAASFEARSPEFRWTAPDVSRWAQRRFAGYRRSDGQVGTRNYWIVVPLVFCESRNLRVLKQAFEEELGYTAPQIFRHQVADLARLYREGDHAGIESKAQSESIPSHNHDRLFPNLDGVRFLAHEGGCGGTREDSRNLCGLIAGYINHPNVAGATVLSLGCQHAQVGVLREQLHKRNPKLDKPLIILEQQRSSSEFAMLSEAVQRTFLGLIEANQAKREPAELSHLCLGLKCGASDGFSGISANPAIGRVADLVVALGGRAILSEFPELRVVEQALIGRSAQPEVGERFASLMRDYEIRTQAVEDSAGTTARAANIAGGLLTQEMKSAGAARKGGSSPVTAVLDYPEYSVVRGLNLQSTPESDAESVTAQVGAGANMVLFTTGAGSATGNPIAPVVKISSSSELFQSTRDMIDVDAGRVVSGELSVEKMGEEILEQIIRVASGEVTTKAEDAGQTDFVPWKRGVSL